MTTTVKLNDKAIQAIDRGKARYYLIKPDGMIARRAPARAFNIEANALKYAAAEGVLVYDKVTKAYLASQPAPAPAAVTTSDAPVIEPRTQTRLAEAEAMLADAGTVEATGSARQTIRWDKLTWTFAKTMAHIPHEWVRRKPEIEADYVELFETIARDGVQEMFGER